MARKYSIIVLITSISTTLATIETNVCHKFPILTGVSALTPEMKIFIVRNRLAFDFCRECLWSKQTKPLLRANKLSLKFKFRLIHFSTDCVFSGLKGDYLESDFSDANDIYGRSKFLGEISGTNSITLRTSFIGQELETKRALLNWFLSQEGKVKGYRNAIYSGLTTLEIARVVDKYVIPNTALEGIYHLSSDKIDKYYLGFSSPNILKTNTKSNNSQ